MKKRRQKVVDLRLRVLRAVQSSLWPMSGREISLVLKIPYKPVVDALNALNAQEKVWRLGRKSTAMWTAQPPQAGQPRALVHLNALFKP